MARLPPNIMRTFLLSLLCCVSTLAFADTVTSIPFPDTASPNGKFALGWGKWTGEPIETSDPDKVIDELVGSGQFDNFIVNKTTGEPLASTGTRYFAIGDRSQNHGSLTAAWRKDSKAVFIIEGAKWNFRSAILMRQVGGDKGMAFEMIDLSQPLQLRLRDYFLGRFPERAEDIASWELSIGYVEWLEDDRISLEVVGQIPKSEEGFLFEGRVELKLPADDWLAIREAS